jgi:hypothetical protein
MSRCAPKRALSRTGSYRKEIDQMKKTSKAMPSRRILEKVDDREIAFARGGTDGGGEGIRRPKVEDPSLLVVVVPTP